LVDPIAKTLDVWRNDAGHWTVVGVYGASETVRAEPFEAIELSLGPLWGLND
jgi:hypothetical protein